MYRLLAFCALVCALGCSSDPLPLRDCTPGATLACACVGGAQGAQSCSAAGTLGACVCPMVDAAPTTDATDATEGDASRPDAPDAPDAAPDVPGLDVAVVDAARDGAADAAGDAGGRDAFVCDADTLNDPANCGACGSTCGASGTSSSPHCVGGRCAFLCRAGFGDCDGNGANGCETGLNTSAANCGVCGMSCTTAHATAACVAGACAVGACFTGWCDRDGDAANGCETSC